MFDNSAVNPAGKVAGGVLALASIAAVIFVTHHPTLGSPGYASLAEEAVAEAAFNGLVHGALILFSLGYLFALSIFSDRLDSDHAAVRAAQISIVIATAGVFGAALLSGFIVPDIAAMYPAVKDDETFRTQLRTLGAANQVLAKTGTIAYGAAVLFWSVRMLALNSLARIIGVIGCIAGTALVFGIFSESLKLDVPGMTVVFVLIGVWFIAVSVLLWFRKI